MTTSLPLYPFKVYNVKVPINDKGLLKKTKFYFGHRGNDDDKYVELGIFTGQCFTSQNDYGSTFCKFANKDNNDVIKSFISSYNFYEAEPTETLNVNNFILTNDDIIYRIIDTKNIKNKYITVSNTPNDSNSIYLSIVTGKQYRNIRDSLPSMPDLPFISGLLKKGGKLNSKTRRTRKPKRKNGRKSRKH